MKPTHDYVRLVAPGAPCRIRVYLFEDELDAPVILVDEPPHNPASPVLDGVGALAAGVFHEHEAAFSGRPVPVFIQYNATRDSYYLLVFSAPEALQYSDLDSGVIALGSPRWKTLDRTTVERLIRNSG
ncbi:MAG: hypothetical protein ACR2KW_04985 [Rubrobacter sp.]